jgi:hypothetical protein
MSTQYNAHCGALRKANVTTKKFAVEDHPEFSLVIVEVRDEDGHRHLMNIFLDEEGADCLMLAMATAAREHFGSAEPEPDYDAIAAEMEEDRYAEASRGL